MRCFLQLETEISSGTNTIALPAAFHPLIWQRVFRSILYRIEIIHLLLNTQPQKVSLNQITVICPIRLRKLINASDLETEVSYGTATIGHAECLPPCSSVLWNFLYRCKKIHLLQQKCSFLNGQPQKAVSIYLNNKIYRFSYERLETLRI